MIFLQQQPGGWNATLAAGAVSSIEEAADTLFDHDASRVFVVYCHWAVDWHHWRIFSNVFYRVWAHMARNEAVDVFPLVRPLVIALILFAYPALYGGLVYMGRTLSDATQEMGASRRDGSSDAGDHQRPGPH